jgi:hypothetical protein
VSDERLNGELKRERKYLSYDLITIKSHKADIRDEIVG